MLDSFTQLNTNGRVEGWDTFTELDGDATPATATSGEAGAVEPLLPRSYAVQDLKLGGGMVTDLKRSQCRLLLEHGVYQTKAWVN